MIEEPPRLRVNMDRRRPSDAQIAAFQGVPTGFVVDAMFGRGALDAVIAPIGFGRDIDCVAAGPAMTADNRPSDIMGTLAALNYLQEGDVMVAGFGGFQGCASAGDRVSAMIKNCGGVGFVSDGPMRDYAGIVDVGLPCWCTGLSPNSPYVTGPASVGFPVQIGGATVATGDMIVADRDGVVVVPFDQINAVIGQLDAVRAAEHALDAQLADGLTFPDGVADLVKGEDVAFVKSELTQTGAHRIINFAWITLSFLCELYTRMRRNPFYMPVGAWNLKGRHLYEHSDQSRSYCDSCHRCRESPDNC